MNCPKCGKRLEMMHSPGYAACFTKTRLEKYGAEFDRKCRVVKLNDSGCGALFQVPLSDLEYDRILENKYRVWNEPKKG